MELANEGGVCLLPFKDHERMNLEKQVKDLLPNWLSTSIFHKSDITWAEWESKQSRFSNHFSVTVPNYFRSNCSRKFLHFFETGTNFLRVLDLSKVQELKTIKYVGNPVPYNA